MHTGVIPTVVTALFQHSLFFFFKKKPLFSSLWDIPFISNPVLYLGTKVLSSQDCIDKGAVRSSDSAVCLSFFRHSSVDRRRCLRRKGQKRDGEEKGGAWKVE